jgi:hypothetical protein
MACERATCARGRSSAGSRHPPAQGHPGGLTLSPVASRFDSVAPGKNRSAAVTTAGHFRMNWYRLLPSGPRPGRHLRNSNPEMVLT